MFTLHCHRSTLYKRICQHNASSALEFLHYSALLLCVFNNVQIFLLVSMAPIKSWPPSRALFPWSVSCTISASSRLSRDRPRRKMERRWVEHLAHVQRSRTVLGWYGLTVFGDVTIFCQLEVYNVNVSDELKHQLRSVIQELGIQVPPPVSINVQSCPLSCGRQPIIGQQRDALKSFGERSRHVF